MGAMNSLNQHINLGKAHKAVCDDPTSADHLPRAKQVLENNPNSLMNEVQAISKNHVESLYKSDVYHFPHLLWCDGSAFHVNVRLYGFGQYSLLPNSVYFGSDFSLIFMPPQCY